MKSTDYRQYRAPREHGSALIAPSLDRVDKTLDHAVAITRQSESRFGDLRQNARTQLIQDAVRYSSAYRNTDWISERIADRDLPPIVMSGHQPSMFHSGVWFKNFALDHIGKQHQAVPINLVIDNDVSAGVSVRVPTIDTAMDRVRIATVAYDSAGGGIPYEQSAIQDRDFFAGFDGRIRRALAGVVDDPCVTELWKHAIAATKRCDIASCALAQARHGFEADLGLRTLEIPMSVASRGRDFARFAIEIIADADRFVKIYNDQTRRYRAAHGIRSSAHPVPNLRREDDWLEMPLWVYGDANPQRRTVWVRRQIGDLITVSDRDGSSITLDVSDRDAAADTWADLVSNDLKLRPRALLTTMYARWILSDLFIHGIGGGKYDQLGDAIAAEFFGIQPPPHMVISATMCLSTDGLGVPDSESLLADRDELRRRLRDAQFQPERFDVAWSSKDQAHVDRKSELLAKVAGSSPDAAWHQEVTRINRALCESLSAQRADWAAELYRIETKLAERRVLDSREHPFCAFPIERICETTARLLDGPRQ